MAEEQIPVQEAPTALQAAEKRSLERVEALRRSEAERVSRRAEELEKLKGFVPVSADPSFTRRVVVQVAKRQRSEGGIELPENMKVKPVVGLVVGLSPGSGPLQVGERVLFMRFAGVDVELPNGEVLEEHKVLRENECFGHWPLHVHARPEGDQPARYEELRAAGKALAEAIVRLTPPSADQTAAIRLVREAVFTANAAIACGGT